MSPDPEQLPLELLMLYAISKKPKGLPWTPGKTLALVEALPVQAQDGHQALLYLKDMGLAARYTRPNLNPERFGEQKTVTYYRITDQGRELLEELGL